MNHITECNAPTYSSMGGEIKATTAEDAAVIGPWVRKMFNYSKKNEIGRRHCLLFWDGEEIASHRFIDEMTPEELLDACPSMRKQENNIAKDLGF